MSGGIAILFWCYRDLPVCENRIAGLRRLNPGTRIFVLYGGPNGDADRFRNALAPVVDDFYGFDREVSSTWKWRNGDLMLADWFDRRGKDLEWDHVFIVQWDMLVLAPLRDL
ncbi:MAG TPA: hypothetical protein VFR41_07445, partial [Acidimicrobiia bacterium]|nr:hypothetical protein [Acidimicrobiia bacterium]